MVEHNQVPAPLYVLQSGAPDIWSLKLSKTISSMGIESQRSKYHNEATGTTPHV
jgi:hypothetical protein